MKNAINWFEIPVSNFERAKKFYETVISVEMSVFEMGPDISAFFPADLENGIGGCIIKTEGVEPSEHGARIYLNGGDDLSIPLGRVVAAGGQVVMEKTSIGPNGFMGVFLDSEGNKVAFHSNT